MITFLFVVDDSMYYVIKNEGKRRGPFTCFVCGGWEKFGAFWFFSTSSVRLTSFFLARSGWGSPRRDLFYADGWIRHRVRLYSLPYVVLGCWRLTPFCSNFFFLKKKLKKMSKPEYSKRPGLVPLYLHILILRLRGGSYFSKNTKSWLVL